MSQTQVFESYEKKTYLIVRRLKIATAIAMLRRQRRSYRATTDRRPSSSSRANPDHPSSHRVPSSPRQYILSIHSLILIISILNQSIEASCTAREKTATLTHTEGKKGTRPAPRARRMRSTANSGVTRKHTYTSRPPSRTPLPSATTPAPARRHTRSVFNSSRRRQPAPPYTFRHPPTAPESNPRSTNSHTDIDTKKKNPGWVQVEVSTASASESRESRVASRGRSHRSESLDPI